MAKYSNCVGRCFRGGGFVLTSANITQRVRIAQALKETERLQTIGQLTGAVAHDFNNHLTIILGNLDVADEEIVIRSSECD